jgi:hypothetical protein
MINGIAAKNPNTVPKIGAKHFIGTTLGKINMLKTNVHIGITKQHITMIVVAVRSFMPLPYQTPFIGQAFS